MPPSQTTSVHAFNHNDALGNHDAVGLSALLQQGKVSATELATAALTRLEQVNTTLTATTCISAEKALETARLIDKGGNYQGFRGLPSLLKDNIDWRGHPTRHGSRATTAEMKNKNSEVANLFEGLGLVLLGKTKTPEFGLTATTEFTRGEPARNPWNPAHSTGGSSGGSAALVAAGVVPLAHANDGGGSIRIPAACCGLVGFKPSRGRLAPNEMAKDLPINLVSDGVVVRSVRDAATFLHLGEGLYPPSQGLKPVGLVSAPSTQRLRIGVFTRSIEGREAPAPVIQAVQDAAELCRSLGHQVKEIDIPIERQFADDFLLYWAMLAFSLHRAGRFVMGRGFDASQLEPLTLGLSTHFLNNLWRLPMAMRRLRRFGEAYQTAFSNVDVLLSPVVGHEVPAIGHLALDLPFEEARLRLTRFAGFTAAQNIAGAPAMSLPMAVDPSGLPIGVHFAGPVSSEAALLGLAYELESAQAFHLLNPLANEPQAVKKAR